MEKRGRRCRVTPWRGWRPSESNKKWQWWAKKVASFSEENKQGWHRRTDRDGDEKRWPGFSEKNGGCRGAAPGVTHPSYAVLLNTIKKCDFEFLWDFIPAGLRALPQTGESHSQIACSANWLHRLCNTSRDRVSSGKKCHIGLNVE